jgi:signal transduction histidine kinase
MLWRGPTGLSAQLRMEWRFTILRFLAAICLAVALPLLELPASRLLVALGVLLLAIVYCTVVYALIRRRSSWLRDGYFTTIGDAVFAVAVVLSGGGFTSDLYFIVYSGTVAAALRFGYGPSMLVVGWYVAFHAVEVFVLGSGANEGSFFLRSGFLAITALLANYLQDQARVAEAAIARQLERASALNESTRALSASLKLDTVVDTIAAEACRLAGGEVCAIRPGPGLNGRSAFVFEARPQAGTTHYELDRQLDAELLRRQELVGSEPSQGQLGDGRWYLAGLLYGRGDEPGGLIVLRPPDAPPFDVSERSVMASFLDRASLAIEKASLYQALDERSRDLQRAYADLASAHQELLGVDEMKTNFIANVSHELRTPLTSIRSFSEILLTVDVDPATQHEFIGIVNAESERLTRLINDVLDITKIESGYIEWHMASLDLYTLMQASGRTISSLAKEKHITFSVLEPEEPIYVWADRDRVQQVLANLLGNAVKFTSQGEIVVWAEIAGDMAAVHVRDTGIGIAPADHDRIFQKFYQLGNSLTEKPTGTGLGLCICRDIVEHHGGQISLESELGAGSIFSFTLPLARVPAAPLVV